MAVLMYVLSIFFWFVPALIFFLVKKDDAFVYGNAVELLNFEITLFGAMFILTFIPVVGWFVMMAIGIAALVFLIKATLSAKEGNSYQFPFTIRLLG